MYTILLLLVMRKKLISHSSRNNDNGRMTNDDEIDEKKKGKLFVFISSNGMFSHTFSMMFNENNELVYPRSRT